MIEDYFEEHYNELIDEITQIEPYPALVVMSGGVDSSLLLYLLQMEDIPIRAIGFNYGQEAIKELDYARDTCNHLKIPFEVVDISSANIAGNLAEGGSKSSSPESVVPNRNSIFLSIATAYAIKYNIPFLYYGATKDDNFSYFDTKPEFVYRFNELNKVSDIHTVQLRAPLIDLSDDEVLDLALDFDLDLTSVWSCYRNTEKPCGTCSMCVSKQKLSLNKLEEIQRKENRLFDELDNYEVSIEEEDDDFEEDFTMVVDEQ